jgi:hypothetical protein
MSMRWLSILIAGVLACAASSSGDDAAPEPRSESFDQPIGTACKAAESALCAGGIGVCHAAICRAFCQAVDLPRCSPGTVEVHDTIDDREICLCTPP